MVVLGDNLKTEWGYKGHSWASISEPVGLIGIHILREKSYHNWIFSRLKNVLINVKIKVKNLWRRYETHETLWLDFVIFAQNSIRFTSEVGDCCLDFDPNQITLRDLKIAIYQNLISRN